MAYNTGFGSANEVLGGSRFVELAPVLCGKTFHEVDTAAPRIPDRLANPVRSWVYAPPVMRDLSIVPKPEPLFMSREAEFYLDPDPQFTLSGMISSKPERTWERNDPELAYLLTGRSMISSKPKRTWLGAYVFDILGKR